MPENDNPRNLPVPVETTNPTQQTGGLMQMGAAPATPPAEQERILCVLARSGDVAKKYFLPKGSTVEDLARFAQADTKNQDITIGKNKVGLDHVLQPNSIVFMVSKPKNA